MAETESIDHLSTLLDSKDINEKTTAITALQQLATLNETINEEILEKGVHCKLMMLLRAWKNDEDEEDMVEGEEDEDDDSKPKEKLAPALINEVLNTINYLVANPDFFNDCPAECFKRIANILKDDKYRKECQVKVYEVLVAAGEQEPDVMSNIADDLSLKLPDDDAAKKAFYCDATYPQTVVKSENDFLKGIIAMIDNESGDELVKINVFDILWNLCDQYINYQMVYGDDEEEDEDEDDDLKDKEKDKAEEKKKNEEEKALCTKYYDWIGKYHEKCIKFILSLLTEKHFKDIQDEVNTLSNTMSVDMSGKLEVKKDENKNKDVSNGDKKKKKKKKKGRDSAVTTEFMDKWTVIDTNLNDKIQTIQLAHNLLTKIFQSDDQMIAKSKDDKEDEGKEETEDQFPDEMDDEQRKKMKKTIISSKHRNEIVGIINEHWINNDFDTKKLCEISEAIGIEIGSQIDASLKDLKINLVNLVYEFIFESIISLSNSQWQSLWNFGCKLFHDDNAKSKIDIPLRQKRVEKMMAKSQKDGDEENKDEMDQDSDDDDGLDDDHLNRDDAQIAYILLTAIKQCKDLKVSSTQIDDLMTIHSRIRNCQQMATKHSIDSIEDQQGFMPVDLVYVNDMNEFGKDINETLKELFKNDVVKKDKDRQRSILNGLYEDCQVLAENSQFIGALIKHYNNVKDKPSFSLGNQLIEWNGGDASQVGFDTCQLILDIMSDDQYAKLTMNKRNFESILKNYKKYQEEWKKMKVVVEEYNKTVDAKNKKLIEEAKKKKEAKKSKKDNENENEDDSEDDEYDSEDEMGQLHKIEWETVDCITKPVEECITNIEKFLKELK